MPKFKAQNKSKAQMSKQMFCHLDFVIWIYFEFCALTFVINDTYLLLNNNVIIATIIQ